MKASSCKVPDGTITALNESACRILGASQEQLIGRISLDDRMRTVHENGSPFPHEHHPAMIALGNRHSRRRHVIIGHREIRRNTRLALRQCPTLVPRRRDDSLCGRHVIHRHHGTRNARKRQTSCGPRSTTRSPACRIAASSWRPARLDVQARQARRIRYRFALLFLDFDHFKSGQRQPRPCDRR